MHANFPPEFDASEYRAIHADLWHLDDAGLAHHYETIGRQEGRRPNRLQTREQFRDLALHCRSLLEIGPYSRPLFIGSGVSYFDVMTRDELVARARDDEYYDAETIPDVHYVSPTGDLSVIPDRFDVVASSHVVEHLPDLVGHFNQVARVLERGGLYFLWIPDKRYCFDAFQTESSIGSVIEAAIEGRTIQKLGSAIGHSFERTHNDAPRHWRGDHGARHGAEAKLFEHIVSNYQGVVAPGTHLDLHAWHFTPGSFRRIVEELRLLRLSPMRAVRVYSTLWGSNEFWAILEVAPAGDPSPWCATS